MKITKRQLRRIIKEEMQLLKEEDYDTARDARLVRGGPRYKPRKSKGPFAGQEGREDATLGIPNRGEELWGHDDHKLWAYNAAYKSGLEWAEGNPHRERFSAQIREKRMGDERLEYSE